MDQHPPPQQQQLTTTVSNEEQPEQVESSKRQAFAGQWRTPPAPVFASNQAPPQQQQQQQQQQPPLQSQQQQQPQQPYNPFQQHHQQPPPPQHPQQQQQQQHQVSFMAPNQLPNSSEDYAKALQEAYRRGAEAAAAMQTSSSRSNTSSPMPGGEVPNTAGTLKPSALSCPNLSQLQLNNNNSPPGVPAPTAAAAVAPPGGGVPGQYGMPMEEPDPQLQQQQQQQQQQQFQHPYESDPFYQATAAVAANTVPMPPPPPQAAVATSATTATYQHPPSMAGAAPHNQQSPYTNIQQPPQPQQPQQQPQVQTQAYQGQTGAAPVQVAVATSANRQPQPPPPLPPPPTQQQQQHVRSNSVGKSVSLPDMASFAARAQDEEEKRKKRLARNRASARLRRLRKKNLVDSYEAEVGILEAALQKLKAHEWGREIIKNHPLPPGASKPSGLAATASVEADHEPLIEALSMERGQQPISPERRKELIKDILKQQSAQVKWIQECQMELLTLRWLAKYNQAQKTESSEDTKKAEEMVDEEEVNLAKEMNDMLQLSNEQELSILQSTDGMEKEFIATQKILDSIKAMDDNDWLLNEGVASITDQFTSILHSQNQLAKFLLWTDTNAEAIEELDYCNAQSDQQKQPASGPVFTFGMDMVSGASGKKDE